MLKLFFTDHIPVGRFSPSSLPDQALMELMYTPDIPAHAEEELYLYEDSACAWRLVECDTDGNVQKIDWHTPGLQLFGSIDFAMLPHKISHFRLFRQYVEGEINVRGLPATMRYFCVELCLCSGTVDLRSVPTAMEVLILKENMLTGITDIQNLPEGMKTLVVAEKDIKNVRIRVAELPGRDLKVDLRGCGAIAAVFDVESDRGRVLMD